MIPKVIHYVWLSNDEKPQLIKDCMSSWSRIMPDYEIKCWNMDNIPHNNWVEEAIKAKKWAFASDYIRLYALFTEGGIYLDSDVLVKKRFDEFLEHKYFTSIEYNPKIFKDTGSFNFITTEGKKIDPGKKIVGLTIQAAIVGAEKEQECIREAMKYYEQNHFLKQDGTPDISTTAPNVMASVFEKRGFIYKNEKQILSNGSIFIYDTKTFASGLQYTHPDNYAIHVYTTAWQDWSFIQRIIRKFKLYVKKMLVKRNA